MLYFLLSTLVLTLYIDVVLSLSISIKPVASSYNRLLQCVNRFELVQTGLDLLQPAITGSCNV